ncbi:MAG: amidohydrolase family protein [Woeseiaceae bacterium]|nr:amidohydrolase family protein [Woeseiaceae bacterium]
MRTAVILLSLLVIAAAPLAAEPVVFLNVNVVPMHSEGVLRARTVIVSDGRINQIGDVDSTPLPEGALVIDGTDRFLLPGLVEMHGHVPGTDSDNLQRILTLYVANGITTVRGMLGRPSHLALREAIRSGERLGPDLITSGPSLNGRSVSGPEQAKSMVERQFAAGYDFLKIHPGLTREEFDAMARTANRLGMRFAGHVPEDVGIARALQAGMATIDHLDGYMEALLLPHDDRTGGVRGFLGVLLAGQADATKIPGVVAATLKAGTWNVPTESLFRHATAADLDPNDLANWPEMKYMPEVTIERWRRAKQDLMADANYHAQIAERAIDLRKRLILELQRSGAGLLLGSDSPQIFNVPGFAIHHELEYLVDAGLTPFEALQTGTANAARFFGRVDEIGVVRQGAIADLVLLDADPLEDIRNSRRIHGVMLRGRWLSRQQLDQLLAELAR